MTEFDISQVKILIVEDNLHFRTLMRTILQALGVEIVEEARDGAEAMEVLASFEADLAIIDWKMDGVDGVECVRRIRNGEDNVNKFLPIIMVTGYTDESLAKEARNAGVNDFLSKPISAKSLLSRIKSVISEDRPFVESGEYFGPDRRRQDREYDGADKRVVMAKIVSPDVRSN
mgnify:CR=1 FL=1